MRDKFGDDLIIFFYLKNSTYDNIHFDVLDTFHENDTDKMYSMTRAAR